MTLEQSINYLNRQGYCLWVGAGVSAFLATDTSVVIPTWTNLVELLEKESNINPPTIPATFPERLEVVLSKFNSFTFRQRLRELILKRVSSAVIAQTENYDDNIPKTIRCIAKLGFLANPIINYNVEAITSQILSIGGGHYSIKTYGKKEIDDNTTISRGTAFSMRDDKYENQRFKRHIYHPHGNIDGYGVSVFTDEDYKKHRHSLAYQLATHSAFDDDLVIVGMSLDDKYLREQIANFRKEIRQIFWFQTSKPLTDEIKKWCWRYDINLITFNNWTEFWKIVDDVFPEPPEKDLLLTWMNIVGEAVSIINDASETESWIKQWQQTGASDSLLLKQKLMYAKRGITFKESLDSEPIISADKSTELKGRILKKLGKLLNN